MDKPALLEAARARMEAEDLSQRDVADMIGASQGHLSKVLRGRFTRESRVIRALEKFASPASPKSVAGGGELESAEAGFLKSARFLAGGDAEVMHLLEELMHLLLRLRQK